MFQNRIYPYVHESIDLVQRGLQYYKSKVRNLYSDTFIIVSDFKSIYRAICNVLSIMENLYIRLFIYLGDSTTVVHNPNIGSILF